MNINWDRFIGVSFFFVVATILFYEAPMTTTEYFLFILAVVTIANYVKKV